MATIAFRQPPLVEIVAEVRWAITNLPEIPLQFTGAPIPVPDANPHETHFMNFASKAGALGYGLVERVVPHGFPLLAYQPTCRYRSASSGQGAPLFQLGPGIFTANISPPYKSWQNFLPIIDLGLGLLLDSWPNQDNTRTFSSVRLRYIDAFGENLRQDKSITQFLQENLGITVELPPSIMKFCIDSNQIKQAISATIPIDVGTLDIKIAEGWVRNMPSLLMDTTITRNGPFAPDKAAILAALNAAHEVIHDSFVGMTVPLHHLMVPEEQI